METIFISAILDWLLGDPYQLPHPVRLMGKLISLEEGWLRRLNGHFSRRKYIIAGVKGYHLLKVGGLFMAILNILLSFMAGQVILKVFRQYKIPYLVVNTYLISTCIAAKGLDREAMKVYSGLDLGLDRARLELSHIVGRDTGNLSETEIIRATVETVAENTSDGVIGPLFYLVLFGLPGGLAYKMVNTMDSMLGYKDEAYMAIGYFPAKIDDVVNLLPARLTGGLMCISSILKFNVKGGFRIMKRDGRNHESPNAAYPEGAVAGLLNIQLGGSSYYSGQLIYKPTIGDRIRRIERDDIRRSIEIMYRTEGLFLLIYGLIMIGR